MIGILYIILILLTLLAAACVVMPLWTTAGNLQRHSSPGIFTGLLIIAFFFAAGFGLYQVWGNSGIFIQINERDRVLKDTRRQLTEIRQKLVTQPQSISLWIESGLAQLELEKYDRAAASFRKATLLSGGAPEILLLYAKALTLEAHGTVTPDAAKAFSMVLLQDPDNIEARYFIAMKNNQQGKSEVAQKMLMEISSALDDSHPFKPLVENALTALRTHVE